MDPKFEQRLLIFSGALNSPFYALVEPVQRMECSYIDLNVYWTPFGLIKESVGMHYIGEYQRKFMMLVLH